MNRPSLLPALALGLCALPLPARAGPRAGGGHRLPGGRGPQARRLERDRRLLPTAGRRLAARERAGGRQDHGGPAVFGRHHHFGGQPGAPGGDPPGQPAPGRPARPGRRGGRAAVRDRQGHRGQPPRHPLHGGGAPARPSMELAHQLATGQDPWVKEILDQTVVVMVPSHNPDGTQKVVEWYRKSVGTPWEGGTHPLPLPPLRRPRQQPRLVHVLAGGEPAHREARLRPLAPAGRARPPPDGGPQRPHLRAALRRPLGAQRRPRPAGGQPTPSAPTWRRV